MNWPQKVERGQLALQGVYMDNFGLRSCGDWLTRVRSFTVGGSTVKDVELDIKVRDECPICHPCPPPALRAGGQLALRRTWLGGPAQATELNLLAVRNTAVFNAELDKVMDRRRHVLGIQSCMGTGKTHMLKTLVQELQDRHGAPRVLLIVYRQSLSLTYGKN
jgi:hypothetical protein